MYFFAFSKYMILGSRFAVGKLGVKLTLHHLNLAYIYILIFMLLLCHYFHTLTIFDN